MSHAERAEVVARTAFAQDWNALVHTIAVVIEIGENASDEEQAVAWLHDVLEDTDVEAVDLRDLRFPPNVITAVELVSRTHGSDYESYKLKLLQADGEPGRIARQVKLADAKTNLRRCEEAKGVPKWERLGATRYAPMVEALEAERAKRGEDVDVDSWALCGNCGAITPYTQWGRLSPDPNHEGEGDAPLIVPAEDPFFLVCPTCRYHHRDDDSDPGVWEGSLALMQREREQIDVFAFTTRSDAP